MRMCVVYAARACAWRMGVKWEKNFFRFRAARRLKAENGKTKMDESEYPPFLRLTPKELALEDCQELRELIDLDAPLELVMGRIRLLMGRAIDMSVERGSGC